jgi:phosphate transport system permease protein
MNLSETQTIIRRQRLYEQLFILLGLVALLVALLTLLALFTRLAIDGMPRLTPDFFTSFPSRFAEKAGILSAWVGSFLVMFVTACAAIPLGVSAGIYLEEYAPKTAGRRSSRSTS